MFKLPENIPLIIFALLFCLIFIVFSKGIFFILTAKKNEALKEKGRKILLNSLYGFSTLLLIVLVFSSVTYILKKRGGLTLYYPIKEFPPSLAVNYPPPPQFIKIGKFYFNGPYLLEKNIAVKPPFLYTILCRESDKYDIISIGSINYVKKIIPWSRQSLYGCWLKNCGNNKKNLYISFFQILSKSGQSAEIKKIQQNLQEEISPVCFEPVKNY
jgi:hypothetical protein